MTNKTIFEHLDLPANHRSQPFQLVKPYDEVKIEKYKQQYPYIVSDIIDGVDVCAIVEDGKATFFMPQGKQCQNMDSLADDLADGMKGDGVLFGVLHVDPEVYTATKLKACISPFRTRELNGKEREAVDMHMKFTAHDMVTIEEFTESMGLRSTGFSPVTQEDRITRMDKALKKLLKKPTRVLSANIKFVESADELNKVVVHTDADTVLVRSAENPWDAGHKNYYWMSINTLTAAEVSGGDLEITAEKKSKKSKKDKEPDAVIEAEPEVAEAVEPKSSKKGKKGKKDKKGKKAKAGKETAHEPVVQPELEVRATLKCVGLAVRKDVILLSFSAPDVSATPVLGTPTREAWSEEALAGLVKAHKKGKKKKSPIGKKFNVSYLKKHDELVTGSFKFHEMVAK